MIIHGNCIEEMKSMPEKSVDLIFADPPYNAGSKGALVCEEKHYKKINESWDTYTEEEYKAFTEAWLEQCARVLKDNGSIYVCCGKLSLWHTKEVMDRFWRFRNMVIWYKPDAPPSCYAYNGYYADSAEYILFYVGKEKPTYNYETLKKLYGKQMRDVWEIGVCRGLERVAHPSQKPEELVKRCVIASSNPGDTVLDPFGGSGTTGVVAKQLNREFILIEKDIEYAKLIKNRLDSVQAVLFAG